MTDLERAGHLVRLPDEVSATLEAAEIQRRVYRSGGPAILFENVAGCRFPMVSNLFGSVERARFMFRETWEHVRRLIELKIDPNQFWLHPSRYLRSIPTALHMRPRRRSHGPVLECELTIDQLPQLKSWPDDGGAFVTLPQVYTEDLARGGLQHSNLGMYRVQLSGGQYITNSEVGLHYQLHRGIGVHHAQAVQQGTSLRVNIFVGGTPAMTLAAVMPLPEGMSELTFAGPWRDTEFPWPAEMDACPSTARRISVSTVRSTPNASFPKGRLATIWGITVWHTSFPACVCSASRAARMQFGRLPWLAVHRKRIPSLDS